MTSLSSIAPAFILGANATLTLENLSIQGAALVLPSSAPTSLQQQQVLSLQAIQLQHPSARVVLRNVRISTPSCTALSVHQAAVCRTAPAPGLTVASGVLQLTDWTSSALSATNVTLTCAGTAVRPPCIALTPASGQELVDALATLQAASSPPPAYIYLAHDVSLDGTIALDTPIQQLGPNLGPLMLPGSLLVVSGGSTPPAQVAAAIGLDAGKQQQQRAPVLDLGGATYFLDLISSAGEAQLHNLTLAGLPLSLPPFYPQGFLRGFVWTFFAYTQAFGDGGLLLLSRVELLVDQHEVAAWAHTAGLLDGSAPSANLADKPPSSEPASGALSPPEALLQSGEAVGSAAEDAAQEDLVSGLMVQPCLRWVPELLQARLVPGASGGPTAVLLTNARAGGIKYEDVVLTSTTPAGATVVHPAVVRLCDFPLWPGCSDDSSEAVASPPAGLYADGETGGDCGTGAECAQGVVGGASLPVSSETQLEWPHDAELLGSQGSVLSGFAPAIPASCRMHPEGALPEAVDTTWLDVILDDALTPRVFEFATYGIKISETVLVITPPRAILVLDASMASKGRPSWSAVQANITQAASMLGNPAGPRLLGLSALPALFNLRSPLASLTLRDLVLTELPTAGLHPSAKRVPPGPVGSDTQAAMHPPPPAPAPAGPLPGLDPTGGLAPGLANFTSCLWTLDFDRLVASMASSSPPPGAGTPQPPPTPPPPPPLQPSVWWPLLANDSSRPTGLPWAFLDGMVLLVPQQELLLLAWCAAHNSTAVVTDPLVAQELTTMLSGTKLLRPDLVRTKLAEQLQAGGSATLTSITFWRFHWCGLQGRNVTLASQLPYTSAEAYTEKAASTVFGLPVDWNRLASPQQPEPPMPVSRAQPLMPAPRSPRDPPLLNPEKQPPVLPIPTGSGAIGSGAIGPNPRDGLATEGGTTPASSQPVPSSGSSSSGSMGLTTSEAVGIAVACLAAVLLAAAAGTWVYRVRKQHVQKDAVIRAVSAATEPDAVSVLHQQERRPPSVAAVALARIHTRIGGLQDSNASPFGEASGVGGNINSRPAALVKPSALKLMHPEKGHDVALETQQASSSNAGLSSTNAESYAQSGGAALVFLGELGRGAQGVVYAGRWRGLDVAIKSILLRSQPAGFGASSSAGLVSAYSAGASAPSITAQVIQEAAIAASLSHPNIVACYTFELKPLLEEGRAGATPTPQASSPSLAGSTTGLSSDPWVSSTASEPEAWRLLLVMERCNAGSLRAFLSANGSGNPSVAGAAIGGTRPPSPQHFALLEEHSDTSTTAARAPSASAETNGQAVIHASVQLEIPGGPGLASTSLVTQDAGASPPALPGLPAALVVRLALHVARGMSYLHNRGVVHGDLSSNNVLLHVQEPDRASKKLLRPHPSSSRLYLAQQQPALPQGDGSQMPSGHGDASLASATDTPSREPQQQTAPGREEKPSKSSAPLSLDTTFSLQPATGSSHLNSQTAPGSGEGAESRREALGPDARLLEPQLEAVDEAQDSGDAFEERASAASSLSVGPHTQMWRLTAKLCDFGLSLRLRTAGSTSDLTHITGPQRRSSLYSAPELVRDGHSGYKQDVYAFGVLLWELACGLPLPDLLERPTGQSVREWLREQAAPGADAAAVPAELLVWPAGLLPAIKALAERCLREQPTERPGFGEVCTALAQVTG